MIRSFKDDRHLRIRWPRTSGDDPKLELLVGAVTRLAPHERG